MRKSHTGQGLDALGGTWGQPAEKVSDTHRRATRAKRYSTDEGQPSDTYLQRRDEQKLKAWI